MGTNSSSIARTCWGRAILLRSGCSKLRLPRPPPFQCSRQPRIHLATESEHGASLWADPSSAGRLFWFAALENIERNDPAISTVKHPDHFFAQPANDQMQVLSARLGLSSSNPVVAGLGAYSSVLQSLGGLLGPAPRTSRRWTGFGRVDWAAGERNRFALEGLGSAVGRARRRTRAARRKHTARTASARGRSTTSGCLPAGRRILAPNLLAVTQVSLGRHFVAMTPETPSPFEQSLNIGDWGRLPQIVVDSRYGFTIGNPSRFGPALIPTSIFTRSSNSWIGDEAGFWSAPASTSGTTTTRQVFCAIRPAPTTTPAWRTSPPMRWPLPHSG